MSHVVPVNYTDCGRIYVEPIRKSIYLIKCIFCDEIFSHWKSFCNHLRSHEHLDQDENHEYDIETEDALKKRFNNGEPEIVLIADYDGEDEETPQNAEVQQTLGTKQLKKTANFHDICTSLEFPKGTSPDLDTDTTSEKRLNEAVSLSDKTSFTFPDEKESKESNRECWFSDEQSSDEEAYQKSVEHSEEEIRDTPSRIKFNVRSANKYKALTLIGVVQHFPSLWNLSDPNYGIRQKQTADYEKVVDILQQNYQISATIDDVRLSFSDMRSWYQRETNTLKKFPRRSLTHPICYRALGKFLSKTIQKSYRCDQCNRSFKQQKQLYTHKYKAHKGPLPFKCDYCDQRFLYQSQKRHHENRHTLGISFSCDRCDYKAPNQADLKLHLARHSDTKPFVCDICGSTYKKSTSLNVHRRTHGKPRYKCDCGKEFYEPYRFKTHIEAHKKMICSLCELQFASKSLLNKHLLHHSVEEKKKEIEAKKLKAEKSVEDFENMSLHDDEIDDFIEYIAPDDDVDRRDGRNSFMSLSEFQKFYIDPDLTNAVLE